MTINGPPVVKELVNSSNPSIVFQARILLLDENPDATHLKELRRSIADSPMAIRILGGREKDGRIQTNPYKKWQGPHWTLYSLAQIDYPPGDKNLLPLREQVYDWLDEDRHFQFPRSLSLPGQPDRFRHCASMEGNAVWYSIKLGIDDERTKEYVKRLIWWQWPDGGWNCDKRPEAQTSSVIESLIPLRALVCGAKKYADSEALRAADKTAEYFLARRLYKRLRDGKIILPRFEKIQYPIQFYDVLFVLTVLCEAGKLMDPRCQDALDLLESKMLSGGGFPLELKNAKTSEALVTDGTFADWGPAGKTRTNEFVTVSALSVLKRAGRL